MSSHVYLICVLTFSYSFLYCGHCNIISSCVPTIAFPLSINITLSILGNIYRRCVIIITILFFAISQRLLYIFFSVLISSAENGSSSHRDVPGRRFRAPCGEHHRGSVGQQGLARCRQRAEQESLRPH